MGYLHRRFARMVGLIVRPGYFTNPIWIAGIVVGIVLMKWIYAVFVESRVQRESENRSIIEQLAAGLFLRCVDHSADTNPVGVQMTRPVALALSQLPHR